MAVVLGTNAGFVTVAPTVNPEGSTHGQDGAARALKHTTPADISKITQMGWYHGNISNDSNYELGLYAHDAGTNLPGALLYSTVATLTGAAEGWKTRTVNWDVNANTIYWLAVQLDAVPETSDIDYAVTGGENSIDVGITTLQNPWVSDGTAPYIEALYAVVEAGTTPVDISGTIAGASVVSGTLAVDTVVLLSGVIIGISAVSGSIIFSSNWQIGSEIPTKRLIQIGNNALWYEDI
jgi:hypothetical protein